MHFGAFSVILMHVGWILMHVCEFWWDLPGFLVDWDGLWWDLLIFRWINMGFWWI